MTTTVLYMHIKLARWVSCLAQRRIASRPNSHSCIFSALRVYESCQFEVEEAAAVDAARKVLAETGGTIKSSTLAPWSGAESFSPRQMLCSALRVFARFGCIEGLRGAISQVPMRTSPTGL